MAHPKYEGLFYNTLRLLTWSWSKMCCFRNTTTQLTVIFYPGNYFVRRTNGRQPVGDDVARKKECRNSALPCLLRRSRWTTPQNRHFFLCVSENTVANRSERCWPCGNAHGEATQPTQCSLCSRTNPRNSTGTLFETSPKGCSDVRGRFWKPWVLLQILKHILHRLWRTFCTGIC